MRVTDRIDLVLNDADVRLYQGDVRDVLSHLRAYGRAWTCDAIVTSPPYLDVRDDVTSVGELRQYLLWAQRWLRGLRSCARPDTSLMLNVGRVHRDGMEIPLADELRHVAQGAGWKLIDTLIWHKVNGGGGRASHYLVDRHEYVLWLAAGAAPYKGFDEARQPYSPATLERYERRWSGRSGVGKNHEGEPADGRTPHPGGALPGSVFTSSVGATKGIHHPTPMDIDLALHLIRLSCPPGGTVLDPFAGSGTTAVAARILGRRAVLAEIDPAHCSEAAARLSQQTLPLPV